MHLLVSTPLQILLVDLSTGSSTVFRVGDGYYFGITHHQRTFVLFAAGVLTYLNSSTNPISTKNRLLQPHQIEWVDEKILVTDTGNNSLAVFDNRARFLDRVYFNEITHDDKDKGRLGNHFNSVHRVEDKVYVVAHNYEKPSEVWVLGWPDLKILGKLETKAAWAHNIWQGEWGLVICDSKHGSLYEVSSGETIWRSDDPQSFTRGLAVSEDYIFVGSSIYQERKERFWKSGKLWILERKTLRLLDEIPLPGSGDVQELRLIGQLDECHNGEVIERSDLEIIRRKSFIIQAAYWLRQRYPSLQRDMFPLSQLVRSAQIIPRWRKTIVTELN